MKKRRNIGRHRNGRWFVHKRANGSQVFRTFGTLPEAELFLAQLTEQIIRGTYRPPVKMKFAEFAAEWLRDYALANVRPRTFETYEAALRNHLVPAFGHLYLNQISRKGIDALVSDWITGGPGYQDRLRQAQEAERRQARAERRRPRGVRLGRSPGTVSNGLTPLIEMLGHAVQWEYIPVSPATGIRRPRIPRLEIKVLNAAEVQRLLAALPDEWRTLYLCLVMTGLRMGEVRALRWQNVDWAAGRIWVRRTADRHGNFHETKTAGSVRAVGLPAILASALRRHRLASRHAGDQDLVFATDRGTPVNDCNLRRRVFQPAVRKAGLPHLRQHDLRHTFASLLIAGGAHPKLISEQLGHTSIRTTFDTYGHLLPQSYDDAAALLDAAMTPKSQVVRRGG